MFNFRIIFVCFLFLASFALWSTEKEGKAPCKPVAERLFASDIPRYFRSQVKIFLLTSLQHYPQVFELSTQKRAPKSAFQEQTVALLRIIQEVPATASERQWHQRFIMTLRAVAKGEKEPETPLSKEISDFLDSFSFWLFSQVDLSNAYVASFEREIGLKRLQDSTRENIVPLIDTIYQSQMKEPSYTGYCKAGYLTDSLMEGNMPSVVVRYGQKRVPVMRVGTMVLDVKNSSDSPSLAIDESFMHYLKAAGKMGKKHLYVNTVRRGIAHVKKNEIEVRRTKLLEGMESDVQLPAFRMITLDKNSDFYFQIEAFSELKEASQFKKRFLQHLFDEGEDGKFYWSKELKGPLWSDRVRALVEKVHTSYFAGKSELTVEERRAFIEIAYVFLIEAAIQQLDVDVANVSCHYCVDRGASLLGLVSLHQLLQQPEVSGLDLSKMMAYLFGPGIFLHNRPIHDYRVAILETAAGRLASAK